MIERQTMAPLSGGAIGAVSRPVLAELGQFSPARSDSRCHHCKKLLQTTYGRNSLNGYIRSSNQAAISASTLPVAAGEIAFQK